VREISRTPSAALLTRSTGGVKTPLTPIRRVPQPLSASGVKDEDSLPLHLQGVLDDALRVGALRLDVDPAPLIPDADALDHPPRAARWIVTRVLRPTIRWPGVIFVMLMHGTNGAPVISTDAVAVLLVRFVSACRRTPQPCWSECGRARVVTRVIVTC